MLDAEGGLIGAVHNVQGISWQELSITGQSNHAGTTPMRLRHDAGYCAAAIACFVRRLADEMGGSQVATVGALTLHPNLINVIAARAELTVDLRNTDEALLRQAERRVAGFIAELAAAEGVRIDSRPLARFAPVQFDAGVAERIARRPAAWLRHAGHDLRRRPRRADDGAPVPHGDDLRAVGQWHQPQPGRAHRARTPRRRRQRAAAHPAGPCRQMKRQTVGNGRSAAASPRTLRKQHAQAVYQQVAGLG